MLTIYSKNNCGYCMRAKALLKNNDIEFEEINIDENTAARDFVITEGHRTMPQIYKDGKLFVEGGFTGLRDMSTAVIKEKLNGIDIASLGSI